MNGGEVTSGTQMISFFFLAITKIRTPFSGMQACT